MNVQRALERIGEVISGISFANAQTMFTAIRPSKKSRETPSKNDLPFFREDDTFAYGDLPPK